VVFSIEQRGFRSP